MNFSCLQDYLDTLPSVGIPGGELIVTQNNETLFHGFFGYSDAAKTKKTAPSDLYLLYSSSKVMTVSAAMRAVEEGFLSLDDEVAKYIPEYKTLTVKDADGNIRPAKNKLLVRHLFMMASGVSGWYHTEEAPDPYIQTHPNATTVEMAKEYARRPLFFEPGTHFSYGLSLDVLGAVVEVASGIRFADYVKSRFAEPLGMEEFYYHHEDVSEERIAEQYRMDAPPSLTVVPKTAFCIMTPYFDAGGGGIITNATSYVKFISALANGGVGPNGARVLSNESIELLRTNSLDEVMLQDYYNSLGNPGYGYGLGVRVLMTQKDEKSGNESKSPVGEFGWGGAAGTYMLVSPEKRVAITYMQQVLNMGGFGYQDHPHNMIRDIVFDILG